MTSFAPSGRLLPNSCLLFVGEDKSVLHFGADAYESHSSRDVARHADGFHDGVDYVEVNLGVLDKPDEALAYLRQVVSDAFGVPVDKIPTAAPWFINLKHVPETTISEDAEMVSESPAIDFDSPALQLFGYQPSNLPTLFSGTLPAQEQGMCLVA